jgi:hypothetical protein
MAQPTNIPRNLHVIKLHDFAPQTLSNGIIPHGTRQIKENRSVGQKCEETWCPLEDSGLGYRCVLRLGSAKPSDCGIMRLRHGTCRSSAGGGIWTVVIRG